MEDLSVTLVQADQVWEDKAANFRNYERLLSGIDQTDLILLPEMFNTGFTMQAAQFAEEMNGETITWMRELAMAKNAVIAGSLIIKENNQYFNRFIWMQPDGESIAYDKKHLFSMADEPKFFTPGHQQITIDYLGWKIKPIVCYDLRFPVFVRNVENYDLLLYVANWPKPRINAWDTLLKARAIENMCYTIGVNRVGEDANQLEYPGHSKAFDFLGNTLVDCEQELGVFIVELNKNSQNDARAKFNFLNDMDIFEIR